MCAAVIALCWNAQDLRTYVALPSVAWYIGRRLYQQHISARPQPTCGEPLASSLELMSAITKVSAQPHPFHPTAVTTFALRSGSNPCASLAPNLTQRVLAAPPADRPSGLTRRLRLYALHRMLNSIRCLTFAQAIWNCRRAVAVSALLGDFETLTYCTVAEVELHVGAKDLAAAAAAFDACVAAVTPGVADPQLRARLLQRVLPMSMEILNMQVSGRRAR